MIKLDKLDEPDVLKKNKESWTVEYLRLHSANETIPASLKYRYRDKTIKDQIVLETSNKCVYCESFVTHVCPGDVEHILPKSKRPDLVFEWKNLTLSCEQCNRTAKNDYYNTSDPLIDPYQDNPEEHLSVHGPFISHKNGSRKGQITRDILDLNRSSLIDRRLDRIKNLDPLIDKWFSEQNPAYKKILKKQLFKEAASSSEYSFIVKEYLLAKGVG